MPASTDTDPTADSPRDPLPEQSEGARSGEDSGCVDPVAHQRLKGLLHYIAEQLRDADPRAFRIESAGSFVLRPRDLSGLPGVRQDLKAEGDHVWLRVERLEATPPPTIGEAHQGMIRGSSDPDDAAPRIDEAAFTAKLTRVGAGLPEAARQQLEERSRAQVEQALESYRLLWLSWAESERPRRRTIQLYGDLFALKHTLEAAETARPIELVCGIAVLCWQLRDEKGRLDYVYPLLTHALELSIDERSMALEVRPRTVSTRVEMDALIKCEIQGAADVDRSAREQLRRDDARQVTPFDPGSFTDIAKLVATNLDSEGRFLEVLARNESVPPAGPHLIVTDAWVIFSRPRTRNVLLEDLARLRQAIAESPSLPAGSAALVLEPSDSAVPPERIVFRGISSRSDASGACRELYFPLPYNEEQETVIERLEVSAGVSVQGPPGTGKTHTIANIICHYLATGRRVLVTSKGETALAVLQGKLPEEVRPLAVALLAGDRQGLRQFQGSIEAIQQRVSQLNPPVVERTIRRLRDEIERAHAALHRIDRRVDEIAAAQLSEVELDGQRIRPQTAARLVVQGQRDFAWFDDSVSAGPEHAPPLSLEEERTLREARRRLGDDLCYVRAELPNPGDLPPDDQIADLHQTLCRLQELRRREHSGMLSALKSRTTEVLTAARTLHELIASAMAGLENLETRAAPWGLELRRKLRDAAWKAEREALQALLAEIERLREARARFLRNPVEVPDEALGCEKTLEAVRRAAETGKPFGLVTLSSGRAKEYVPSIRVAGVSPRSTEEWRTVEKWFDLHLELRIFATRWNVCAAALDIPSISASPSALRELEALGDAVQAAYRFATDVDPQLCDQAVMVFESPPIGKVLGSSADLAQVRDCLADHLQSLELARSTVMVSTLAEKLQGGTGEVVDRLREFVSDLGREQASGDAVGQRYTQLMAELRRIVALSSELLAVRDFTHRIEAAGAPRFAERLRSIRVGTSGDDAVFPVNWKDAWHWARLKGYLESIEGAEELRQLSEERTRYERALEKLYREIVANAAWLATKRSASHKVMQALAGYATAVRRIGKGTGPNAIRYRRDAQNAMQEAAGAIPCWIMSHYKVSESMPARLGVFDLVIVDEASQSDLSALPAILRGKKILVVGDDKQVSPDAGFIHSQHIQALLDRFLADQPYRADMTPEKSLYDLAARVYAGEQIMLKEHFRCVPPIIAYSNSQFYHGHIVPLRIPRASERLDPPLVDIYVPDGIRGQQDYNTAEAEAIAAEIEAILADERFKGRSLGVVSLLGIEQAKRIDGVVRAKCDAAELHRRHFECGDARTFQGSERDVMFLSLVVDRDNCKALSGSMFEQRFNVAASRARDRMYLVRSVELGEISENDLRRSLLEHFRTPLIADREETENLVERCESGFEREVFQALASRGYRVIPQVKTGAYRLDMVVEGEDDRRLAIECDGDEFHGPERWEEDTRRQRVLERAGWTFWRCFASTWTLRREEMLEDLIGTLSAMGIEPVGALARMPRLVEQRTWKRPAQGSDPADRLLAGVLSGTESDP